MKICRYLRTKYVFLNASFPDKESALRFVADTCAKDGIVEDANALYAGMKKREQTMSTGIGGGIALPHTTSREAQDAFVILIHLTEPIDFEALDALPVDIILALIVPENQRNMHLRILAGVSRLCGNPEFLETVRKAVNPKKLCEEISNLEEKMPFH